MAEDDCNAERIVWKPTRFPEIEASNLGSLRKGGHGGRLLGQHVAGSRPYYFAIIDTNHTRVRVSTLVCEAFHGPRPSKMHLSLHNNGDSTDNRARNLRWGTQKENRDDMIEHGTVLTGERNPNAKLTEDQVRQIRALLPPGRKRGERPLQSEVAAMFGITQGMVGGIVRGESWKHLL